MSCPPSPGRTPTARATSATWPVSVCPPTSSAGTCGWPATTSSWSPGTDEHGTPILVAADQEGVTARELADKNNSVIVHDLVDLGLSYDLFTRTTTGNHYKVVQELFETVHRNGYLVEQTTFGRDQPVDRPHPARPLHRGHLPDLRVPRRARRPVRQLRQPARPDRPDQPALQDQRGDAGVRRDPALLPRPAGAGRGADGVPAGARGVRHLAAQRHQVLDEPDRGPAAAGDDPGHRLGHPGPDRRAGASSRPSGSTSGSTR